MTRTRRSFTDEFKREAVKLCKQPGATVTHIARDLGIQPACSDVGSPRSVVRFWTSNQTDRFAVRLQRRWSGCNANCVV